MTSVEKYPEVRHAFRIFVCQKAAGGIMEDYRSYREEQEDLARRLEAEQRPEFETVPEDEVPFHIPRD